MNNVLLKEFSGDAFRGKEVSKKNGLNGLPEKDSGKEWFSSFLNRFVSGKQEDDTSGKAGLNQDENGKNGITAEKKSEKPSKEASFIGARFIEVSTTESSHISKLASEKIELEEDGSWPDTGIRYSYTSKETEQQGASSKDSSTDLSENQKVSAPSQDTDLEDVKKDAEKDTAVEDKPSAADEIQNTPAPASGISGKEEAKDAEQGTHPVIESSADEESRNISISAQGLYQDQASSGTIMVPPVGHADISDTEKSVISKSYAGQEGENEKPVAENGNEKRTQFNASGENRIGQDNHLKDENKAEKIFSKAIEIEEKTSDSGQLKTEDETGKSGGVQSANTENKTINRPTDNVVSPLQVSNERIASEQDLESKNQKEENEQTRSMVNGQRVVADQNEK
ncbi:hypothetical protein QLX67_08240, partial [Balneolaceae bacterium ANBcel3]|nr:hypothetical protein [Balneolaceae bacterium ANBcel3]